MALGKSLSQDGVVTKLCWKSWNLTGIDFADMISTAIPKGRLLLGMNKGLVVLLLKEGDLEFIQ